MQAVVDVERRAILFSASIFDAKAKRLVRDKLVKAVSVSVEVDIVENGGEAMVRDGFAHELSLVEDPACKTCKIISVENSLSQRRVIKNASVI